MRLTVQRAAQRFLERSVPDPALRAKLTPDYAVGCKRILASNDYFPALQRPNVELITERIVAVTPAGLVTADGVEREADAIIFGTGFRVTTQPIAGLIRGREGRTLGEVWGTSPRAHLGTSVPGFPNMFFLQGPNTGLGNSSVIYMIERQVEYVVRALRYMGERGAAMAAVDRRMRGTVWTAGGCASWYLDAAGRNSTLWPGYTWQFARRLRRFEPSEYLLGAG
jgi:cation diffusion facilitator CzcD-associated flavoprotein CzcO